ncbi:MAG: FlgD immunoglobulin-like domain containing protein, partial [bacterium]
FPNPFFSEAQRNAATVIRFALPRPEEISLTIYNQLGQKIRTISTGRLAAGLHERAWDGRDTLGAKVASGIYFYRLQAGQQTKIQKLIVIR